MNAAMQNAGPARPVIQFCGDAFLRTRTGGDPFEAVRTTLADVPTFVNLETSLASEARSEKRVSLMVEEDALDMLPQAVQFVGLVNNHADDTGGARALAEALRRRGKTVLGPENPSLATVEVGPTRVSFVSAYFRLPRLALSYRGGLARDVERLIRSAPGERKIVSLHWGYEHVEAPALFQRDLARRFAGAGADLIIGHHPHMVQGWEALGSTHVFYSLGNFNFWQFDGETTWQNRLSLIVRYDLESGTPETVACGVNEDYRPEPLAGAALDRAEEHFAALRNLLSIGEREWFGRYYRQWYERERAVYAARAREGRNVRLALKFLAWYALPLQWKYYVMRMTVPRGRSDGAGPVEEGGDAADTATHL